VRIARHAGVDDHRSTRGRAYASQDIESLEGGGGAADQQAQVRGDLPLECGKAVEGNIGARQPIADPMLGRRHAEQVGLVTSEIDQQCVVTGLRPADGKGGGDHRGTDPTLR